MFVGAVVGFLFGAASTGFGFTVAFSARMARVETKLETLDQHVKALAERQRTRMTDGTP